MGHRDIEPLLVSLPAAAHSYAKCIGNRTEDKRQRFFYCTHFVFNYFNSTCGISSRVIKACIHYEFLCCVRFDESNYVLLIPLRKRVLD